MKINRKLIVIIILFTAAFAGIASCTGRTNMTCVEDIKHNLQPLPGDRSLLLAANTTSSEAVSDYLSFYGLDIDTCNTSVKHSFGKFTSGPYSLLAHIYVPENYTAVLVCLHGYLNHVGQLKNPIKHFTSLGYAVACFDMPGHGLSTGTPGSITEFDEYTQALQIFTYRIVSGLHGPYYLAGFSMGGAAVIDYLLTDSEVHYQKIVLAAPLVHNYGWKYTNLCSKLYKPFAANVPRIKRDNTSNKQFNRFVARDDYLQLDSVPLAWHEALHRWNEKIEKLAPVDYPVLILQGTKDTVVDYKYNMEFLKHKLSNSRIEYIKDARHELFNEAEPMRSEALEQMESFLRDEQ